MGDDIWILYIEETQTTLSSEGESISYRIMKDLQELIFLI